MEDNKEKLVQELANKLRRKRKDIAGKRIITTGIICYFKKSDVYCYVNKLLGKTQAEILLDNNTSITVSKKDLSIFYVPDEKEKKDYIIKQIVELNIDKNYAKLVNTYKERDNDYKIDLSKKQIYDKINSDTGIKLTDYQQTGVKFMLSHDNVLNADQMGVGKTFQAIATALLTLNNYRTLIVVPAVLRKTWIEDGFSKMGLLDYVHTANSRTKLNRNKKFLVVSYNYFRTNMYKLISEYPPDTIIFDEVHFLKNNTSQRFNAGYNVRKIFPKTKIVSLSGTPMINNIADMFVIYDLLHKEKDNIQSLAKNINHKNISLEKFENRFEDIKKEINQFTIRRLKKDIMKLPSLFRRLLYLELDQKDEQEYIDILNKYNKTNKKSPFGHELRQLLSNFKIKYLKDIIDIQLEKGLKVVLFFHYKSTIEQVKNIYPHTMVINGSTKEKDRKRIINHLKESKKPEILLLSDTVGGTGLNLQFVNDAIMLYLGDNPALLKQMEARFHRKGQKKDVYIYYPLLTSEKVETIEMQIWKKIKNKDKLFTYIFDDEKNPFDIKASSKEDIVNEIKGRDIVKEVGELLNNKDKDIDLSLLKHYDNETSSYEYEYTQRKKSEAEKLYFLFQSSGLDPKKLQDFIKNKYKYVNKYDGVDLNTIADNKALGELKEDKERDKIRETATTQEEYKKSTRLIYKTTIKKKNIFIHVYDDEDTLENTAYSLLKENSNTINIDNFSKVVYILDKFDREDIIDKFIDKLKIVYKIFDEQSRQYSLLDV